MFFCYFADWLAGLMVFLLASTISCFPSRSLTFFVDPQNLFAVQMLHIYRNQMRIQNSVFLYAFYTNYPSSVSLFLRVFFLLLYSSPFEIDRLFKK